MVLNRNSVIGCLIAVLCYLNLISQEFTSGLDAFNAKDYTSAAEMFTHVIDNEPSNSSAYYNLGIVQMQQSNYGEAIWAFENVLKLATNDSPAKDKIEQCYEELNRSGYWTPRLSSLKSGLYSWSSNIWSLIALTFSLLISLSLLVFHKSKVQSLKRMMIVAGVLGIFCMVISVILAKQVKEFSEGKHYAVVTKKTIPTFIEKEKKGKTVLIEGTQLRIVPPDTTKYVVVIANSGQEHLVRSEDLAFF